jgi:hypothetical protein
MPYFFSPTRAAAYRVALSIIEEAQAHSKTPVRGRALSMALRRPAEREQQPRRPLVESAARSETNALRTALEQATDIVRKMDILSEKDPKFHSLVIKELEKDHDSADSA